MMHDVARSMMAILERLVNAATKPDLQMHLYGSSITSLAQLSLHVIASVPREQDLSQLFHRLERAGSLVIGATIACEPRQVSQC